MPARAFTLTREETEANPSVVTGTLFIYSIPVFVLFDSGATHSFISDECVKRLGKQLVTVESGYNVMFPSGATQQTDQVLKSCEVLIEGRKLDADLILLDLSDYDVIFGMDWLSKYGATIDCQRKMIMFQLSEEESFTYVGRKKNFRFPMVSAIRA